MIFSMPCSQIPESSFGSFSLDDDVLGMSFVGYARMRLCILISVGAVTMPIPAISVIAARRIMGTCK